MENSIYVGLSRSIALQREMDTVANNIANMNTAGYRSQHMMFKEYVEKPRGIQEPLSMVLDYGQYMSNKPGSVQLTGRETDVAISGPGFLSVQNGDETLYTRAGNLARSGTGELVTADGKPVLTDGGGPINIPDNSIEIRISENGTVSNQDGELGRLAITEFENINQLDPVGEGMYRANVEGAAATETRLIQGAVEGSNVNPINEMTRMISVHRAYQSTQRMLQNEHERQTNMIQKMTRT
jgi:flagellar basal-body rod protein FlgF